VSRSCHASYPWWPAGCLHSPGSWQRSMLIYLLVESDVVSWPWTRMYFFRVAAGSSRPGSSLTDCRACLPVVHLSTGSRPSRLATMVWFLKGLKASTKCHSSSSLRRLALTEESAVVQAPISAPLASVSQAGSLATTSCSSNGSCDAVSPFAEQQQLQQSRNPLRRRSLPAMHLLEQRSSLR
jgi:hypothetical protein